MKSAAWVIAALLAGLVLGSLPLKADLRKARAEIKSLKEQFKKSGTGKRTQLDGITMMLKIPEEGATPAAGGGTPKAGPVEGGSNAVPAPKGMLFEPPGGWTNHPHRRRHEMPDAKTMKDRIREASNLWKVRGELARNSFVSTVATDETQVARFDVLMAAMNLRLSNSIRTWVDYLNVEETMTPEAGVRMMSELSGVMVTTYDDLDRDMPEDWRTTTEGKFELMDFVNPEVATPLIEVEGLIREREQARGNAWTNSPAR